MVTIETGERPVPYYLSEELIGGQNFEIDANMHSRLNEALTILVSTLDIEESFQVFAHSFLRFEKDLLDMAFEFTYKNWLSSGDEEFFGSVRHRFNVNIITILTSFRSYDDQCNRITSSMNLPEAKKFNAEIRAKTFDAHLSYRICNKLRDYAQHRALPLGGFSIGGKTNLGRDSGGKYKKLDTGFNVFPWLNVTQFKSSSQCKAGLKEELDRLGFEKIDMKWLVRSFAGAMYERHAALRVFLRPFIEAAGQEIAVGYDFASQVKGSEAKFLELHEGEESRFMSGDLADKVLNAFKTYSSLMVAKRSYITSQIISETSVYTGEL